MRMQNMKKGETTEQMALFVVGREQYTRSCRAFPFNCTTSQTRGRGQTGRY